MSLWTISQPVGDRTRRTLTNLTTGQSLDFTVDDGALLAYMLDGEFPECEECTDRACLECDTCREPGCACQCTPCPQCQSLWRTAGAAAACCTDFVERDEEPSS